MYCTEDQLSGVGSGIRVAHDTAEVYYTRELFG